MSNTHEGQPPDARAPGRRLLERLAAALRSPVR